MESLKNAWNEALLKVAGKKTWNAAGETEFERRSLSTLSLPARFNIMVVSGPTGVGKSTILRPFEERSGFSKFPNVFTRDPRPGERPNIDLIHMSEEEFRQAEREGRFLQTNKRHGYSHGLLRDELLKAAAEGRTYLDKSGPSTNDLLVKLPPKISVLAVYILPPDFTELWRRITGRAADIGKSKHEDPAERVKTSIKEFADFGHIYQVFIVNDDIDRAVQVLLSLIPER